jgi:hypothetical protein
VRQGTVLSKPFCQREPPQRPDLSHSRYLDFCFQSKKNKGHPPVASGRLVEMKAYGLFAVRLFQALLLGGRS